MRIGILTGGGDCPGLNAVIRAVVRKGDRRVRRRVRRLPRRLAGRARGRHRADGPRTPSAASCRAAARSSAPRAPTRTSVDGGAGAGAWRPSTRLGIDALIPIGGEDTLGVATKLAEAGRARRRRARRRSTTTSTPPTTRSASTPPSASRWRRSTGCTPPATATTARWSSRSWAGTPAGSRCTPGMAGGANVILIPENPFDVDAVVAHCQHRFDSGYSPIVVVSEGATPKDGDLTLTTGEKDAFGHVRLGGIGAALASLIEERTGKRGAGRRARAHPARRHADAVRPGAGHPVRAGRGRRRPRRAVGRDGRAARHRHRPGAADRGHRAAEDSCPPERYAEAEVFFG